MYSSKFVNILENRLFRNFSVLLSSNIVTSVVGMFTTIILARNLSPNFYGEYGVILSYLSMLNVFSSFGINTIITRDIARDNGLALKIFYSSNLVLILGFVASILLSFLLFEINFIQFNISYLYLVFLILLSNFISNNIQSVSFGVEKMEHIGIISLIISFSTLLFYINLSKDFFSVKVILLTLVFAGFLKNLLLYVTSNYRGIFNNQIFKFDEVIKYAFKLIKLGMPFYIMGFFSMFSNQLPIQFLNNNSNFEEVAFFNTANKLLLPITLFIGTALTAFFPTLSKLYTNDFSKYKRDVIKALKLIFLLGIVAATFFSLFKVEIVLLIFGIEYKDASNVLAYQVWFMLFFSIFNFIGSILSSSDNNWLLTFLSLAYCVVSVTILWFSSFYGAEMLSIGFLVSAIINLFYHWFFMEKILDWPFTFLNRTEFLLLLLIPALFLFLLPADLSIVVRLLLFLIIIFTSLIYLIKTLKK
tara:strand:+ start:7678 stop:9099 length:1422 start_codon:yes stop_codon:yes gene_type:complete